MAGLLAVLLLTASLGANAAPSLSESQLSRRLTSMAGLGNYISEGCQTTLSGLMSSPASTCLNIPGTVAILSTVANSSWIPPTNTWLSNFCAADSCTSDQISATISIVTNGCAAEFALAGVTNEFVIEQAVTHFDVAKQALCVRDSGNGNKLCAITTLEAVQTALGGEPLTPSLLISNYPRLLANNYALARQLACTPCASAAFALVRPALPQEFLSMIDSFVGEQCGVDFTSTPTGSITVVTGTKALAAARATASTNASVQLSAHGALLGAVGIFSVIASLF
jgi:hypothetical protein